MNKLIRFPSRGSPALAKAAARAVEQKAPPVLTYPASLFWNSNVWDRDPKNGDIGRGVAAYAASALAYICMRFRATKIVEPPLWIQEETPDGDQWLTGDHPLAELLEQPNPDMEMADLLEATMLFMDTTGKCLWVKSRDRAGRVAALYPFDGDEFSVEQADGRMYGRFVVRTSRGNKIHAPEDVVFFRNIDPRYSLDGFAPLEAALAHINIGANQLRAVRAIMRNAIKPSGTLTFDSKLEEGDRENVEAQLRALFSGVDNSGKVMILEGGGKLERITTALSELALGAVQDDVEATVCAVFQVHPALVGANVALKNSSGLSDSLKPAQTLFYDLCAFPTWGRIEKTLTKQLLREVDDNPLRFLRFDKSKVRALEVDLLAKTQEANNAADYWTRDERRVHTGKPPLPDDDPRGDEIGRSTSNPFADFLNGAGAGKSRFGAKKSKRVIMGGVELTADDRKARWEDFDQKARGEEDKYRTTALSLFHQERADVSSLFQGKATREQIIAAALDKIKERYAKDGEYHAAWLERFRALIAQTVKVAGDRVGAIIGFDFDLANPRVVAAIESRANRLAGNVSDTTYQQIKDVIAAARSEGVGVSQIGSRISDQVFGGTADDRSTVIARTETVGALNAGEYVSAAESGVIQSKEWLTQRDSRVRESHDAQDGAIIGIDDTFPNGLLHPGDPRGEPEEIIQCRCTLLYHDEPAKRSRTRRSVKSPRRLEITVGPPVPPAPPVPKKVKKEISYHSNGDGLIKGATVIETIEEEP